MAQAPQLLYDNIKEVVAHIPTLTGHAVVVHMRRDVQIGWALHWEQAYWLHLLEVKKPCDFRKDQKSNQILERLAAWCDQPESYTSGTSVRRGVRDICLRSVLMLPWLLQRWYWRMRGGKSTAQLASVIRSWLVHAQMGLRVLDECGELSCSMGGHNFNLRVDGEHATIEQWDAMLAARPPLQASWLRFIVAHSDFGAFRPTQAVDVSTAWLWLCDTLRTPLFKLEGCEQTLRELHNWLVQVIAIGLESFVCTIHLPTARRVQPAPLYGKKRKLRMDPDFVLHCIKRARQTGGSSSAVTSGLVGYGGLDQRVTSAMITLHRHKCQGVMAGARAVTAQWDPGCYGNKHWSIGLLARTEDGPGNNVACDLVPKV